MFEGLVNQELEENAQVMANRSQPLLKHQEVEELRTENCRAHDDFSALFPNELNRVSR